MLCFDRCFMRQILTAINNALVTDKKKSKIKKSVKVHFVETVFVGIVFVEVLLVVSIISLYIITESPIILPAYLPFS